MMERREHNELTPTPLLRDKGYPVSYDMTLLTEDDLYLFNEGNHFCLYD
jgi:hypothetical protein